MIAKICLLPFLIVPNLLHAADFSERSAKRLDGSMINYYVTRPSGRSTSPLMLVVQGSSCKSIYDSALGAGPTVDKTKIARIDLEKYGLDKTSKKEECPKSYFENNSIDQRIGDYLRVIQTLRGQSSWWNGQLIIVGGSEGGMLAPILATYIPETKKVVVMAGGTGWTMREEMLFLLEKELRGKGFSEEALQLELSKMSNSFNEAVLSPTGSKTYCGSTNTYKWWASILSLRPLNFMVTLDIPILMVHGDADVATPVESARATVQEFKELSKSNLKYIEYPGLDHHWINRSGESKVDQVLNDIIVWIMN